jgi:uncharacterized protein YacL
MADYPSTVYIVDTNLLLDLCIGEIIVYFFKLSHTFITPDVILAELQTVDPRILIELGLKQSELTGDSILKVIHLRTQYRQLSINDLFALVTAQLMGGTLLTGDGNLRKAAHQEGVLVHGTLWVLDEMVRLAIISGSKAAEALTLMCDNGSRFPQDECNKRLREWLSL